MPAQLSFATQVNECTSSLTAGARIVNGQPARSTVGAWRWIEERHARDPDRWQRRHDRQVGERADHCGIPQLPSPLIYEKVLYMVNDMGDGIYATPALVDGRIYLRTLNTLYCFGKS